MTNPQTLRVNLGGRRWNMHEVRATAPWCFGEHRHEGFCDLTLVGEGMVHQTLNGREQALSAGMLCWVRERDAHLVRGNDLRYFNINLSEDHLRLSLPAAGREAEYDVLRRQPLPPAVQLGRRAVRVEAEWQRLFNLQHSPEGDLVLHQVLLGALVELLLPLLRPAAADDGRPAWLQRALAHVDRHLEDGVTTAELAEVCGRSPEHVSRTFKRCLGLSPSAWINRQRLSRAALLLSSTNREILDICYSVGFQSASYFYRLFGRAHGCPPLAYRRRHNPMFQPPAGGS